MNNLASSERDFFECYDIGGTNIRAALINDGRIIEPFINVSTEKNNIESFIQQIKQTSFSLRKQHPGISPSEIKAVSIAVPGPVEGMTLQGSKPLEFDEEINFKTLLGDYFNIPMLVGNDLNMAVQGELALGNFRGTNNFCLLTLSTGIGVGVIINGSLYNRRTEIGHNIIERNPHLANPCLGHSGCWVAQASGSGIEKTVETMGEKLTTVEIFEEPKFQQLLGRVREYNAYGIGNLINAYDPEKIIVMGSLGLKQFNKVIPEPSLIRRYTMSKRIPEVLPTVLGEEIGLLGAFFSAKKV